MSRVGPDGSGEAPALLAVIVAPEPLGRAIAEEIDAGVADVVLVRVVHDVTDALAVVGALHPVDVPIVVISSDLGSVDETIAGLDRAAAFTAARTLVVTDRSAHTDLGAAVDGDRIDAVVAIPWTAGTLATHARSQVARWLRAHRPDDQRLDALVLSDDQRLDLPASELLADLELGPDEVAARLVAAIERVLGPRPRLRLPTGTRLTHQDHSVDGVVVVLDGHVALDRTTPVGDLRLHHDSTGPVIGLLALAQQRRAYFTARTTSEAEVVHLSLEQLDRALAEEAEVGGALAAVAIRALARRLRRSEQLQIERIELNRELDRERQRLSEALHQLEQARLELVEQARFATLGELAAGVAHELNNPTAVLHRAASYVAEDLDRVLTGHPDADVGRRVLAAARARTPRSTADERAARRELERVLGDPVLARRLTAVGIDDPDEARGLVARGEATLDLVEAAAGLGGAVQDLELASRRVGELVASLRAYARPDAEPVADVDLHAGLEDTIRLTAHRLRGIDLQRAYGQLPPVRCHPGQLDQVWTNLLVNAAEELDGSGSITIATDRPDPDHVRIRIVDDGPGIDPDVLPRVFEPRFTTKQGTVRYGLGLGLAIARRIVEHHGGSIALESRPGRTVAIVVLPVAGPPDDTPA
ncbi:sensor histidine kinase [Nitriliruptor alkaliphilus]|uniref:sensor histidine kinase n=1 Tax=Nitriliruptor alkaliphilus TaxID=427918 RepID=UPI000698FD0B|nr:ATP-binding protein [Nitriliruptor alkaliphilus]